MQYRKLFGQNRFSRFDVYVIQTNKHPDKQRVYIDGWKEASNSDEPFHFKVEKFRKQAEVLKIDGIFR